MLETVCYTIAWVLGGGYLLIVAWAFASVWWEDNAAKVVRWPWVLRVLLWVGLGYLFASKIATARRIRRIAAAYDARNRSASASGRRVIEGEWR